MSNFKLKKIGELSKKLNISQRTLRYYEEIGLISSVRDEESNYRYYTSEAENTLKQILILRKIDISIKSILEIFESTNRDTILQVLSEKVKEVEENIENLNIIKNTVESILRYIQNKYSNIDLNTKILKQELKSFENVIEKEFKIKKERIKMENTIMNDNQVRIIRLKPCKVAYYRVESASPEMEAWSVMRDWVKSNALEEKSITRYFGFNNPNPVEGKTEYGYEVWVTVEPETGKSDKINLKEFDGGTYAVTTANGVYEIGDCWKKLSDWVNAKKYVTAQNQCLEEHIIIDENSWGEKMQIDLFYPINI